MTQDIHLKIEAYIGHFRSKLQRLTEYNFSLEDQVFKKNILVSMLDALSRTTSKIADGNRERFTNIVKNFGDWPDHSRVSAPHVNYLLVKLDSPNYRNVRKFITDIITQNSDGSFIFISNDPELEELRKYWPVPVEQNVMGKINLLSCTHLNLLYQYRNSLIHELREPGKGMEFHQTHQRPFYHEGSDGSLEECVLELVYPLNFYFHLTKTIIDNVERYLLENKIDPYSCYQFGSSWIGELNSLRVGQAEE